MDCQYCKCSNFDECLCNSGHQCISFENGILHIPDSFLDITDKDINDFLDKHPGLRENLTVITGIYLPKNLRIIAEETFVDFTDLECITIPKNVFSIDNGAFCNCINLSHVEFLGNPRIIEEFAFYRCNLSRIRIPDSVNHIGAYAFGECSNLEHVKLPQGLSKIIEKTFYRCWSLEEIIIPQGVLEICEYAFENCINLRKVKLPPSINKIDEEAFINVSESLTFDLGYVTPYHMAIDSLKYFTCEGIDIWDLGEQGNCEVHTLWLPDYSPYDTSPEESFFKGGPNYMGIESSYLIKQELVLSNLGGDQYILTDWNDNDTNDIMRLLLEQYPELEREGSFKMLFEGQEEPVERITSKEIAHQWLLKEIDISKPVLIVYE